MLVFALFSCLFAPPILPCVIRTFVCYMVRRDGSQTDWLCRFCKRGALDAPLSNRGTLAQCRGCRVAKGNCFLRIDDSASGGPGKGKGKGKGGTFAERQVQQQRQQQQQQQRQQQQQQKQQRLAKENAELRKKVKEFSEAKDDVTGEQEADDTDAKKMAQLQAAIKDLEAHKDLPGVSVTLSGLQAELAAARLQRDSGKPPVLRLLQAQRLAAKRTAALTKATAAKASAAEALAKAHKALVEATAAEDTAKAAAAEAQSAVDAAASAAGQAAPQPSEDHWDTITAVLTQLHHLPAAMAAGNGNAAWINI